MDSTTSQPGRVLALASTIVTAYVGHHRVGRDELPDILRCVHGALSQLGKASLAIAAETHRTTPAEIRRSIAADRLISFEDGRPYQSLRRHLTGRGLTPEQYRAKWGLPSDYPMTSPGYSARRSELARASRFGHVHREQQSEVASADQEEPAAIGEQTATVVDLDEISTDADSPGLEQHRDEDVEAITREPFEEDGEAEG